MCVFLSFFWGFACFLSLKHNIVDLSHYVLYQFIQFQRRGQRNETSQVNWGCCFPECYAKSLKYNDLFRSRSRSKSAGSKSYSHYLQYPLNQWFSTLFGWRHTFHQKNFCCTAKTRKILKITPKNFCFCIKLLGFENCRETKIINNWTSELKSQGKFFGGTPVEKHCSKWMGNLLSLYCLFFAT